MPGRIPSRILALLKESLAVSLVLFRIMIPVVIAVKILEETGAVDLAGRLLSPLMAVVGLPGSMGLVWATAMITNLYGGIVTFVSVAPPLHMTVAQVTVVCTMMLVAHSLPVELGVARQAGARMRIMLPLRVGGAIVIGAALSSIFDALGMLGGEARILWQPAAAAGAGLGAWALGQVKNLLSIFLIVTALIALLKILRRTGFTDLLDRGLRPVLVSMGIGPSASTITIFGMILGLSYGGGLIISGARSGSIPPRDVFFSLCLMGLAHSLVEDSLLMLSLGASAWGVFAARTVFAWAVLAVLVRAAGRIPDGIFLHWFCTRPSAPAGEKPGS
ncbi:MAG: hypothetical protein QUS11_03745 [Candidatus Fermentibacter sp.]|nr:hypothetical protein [Candidatus Fermentibacter sp.]